MKQFAPCKINLYLHILGKRADGFHELETLMAPLSFGDELEIEAKPEGIELTCSDTTLPVDSSNLAYRAADLFLKKYPVASGVRIHIQKKVPVGAGLGGGSSDGANVLLAMRRLFSVETSDADLAELAAQLGSDVPFFIYQKPALCRGRGEIIEPTSLGKSFSGLLVHPGFGVSTPWAYKTYAQQPSKGIPGKSWGDFSLRNDLEPPVFSKYLWLPTAKKWFQEQPGVWDSLMSGSGSSVFALMEDGAKDRIPELKSRFHAEFGENLFSAPFEIADL